MAKQERPLEGLAPFLPPHSFEALEHYFCDFKIYLTLTKHRNSLHGDYRAPDDRHPYHRISVNATLNPYSFLITLVHELAHLLTTVQHGLNVPSHGPEWKAEFRQALLPFLGKDFFPSEVEVALQAYLKNPAASTCGDPHLYMALARYDAPDPKKKHVWELAPGALFELQGKRFQKLEQLRSRSRCKELDNGKIYFVQGVAIVTELP
ncbi:MAG: hypothetical protein JST06_04475 [Bacteroidetes bacterium]|nr:hypothetical protein [Bacteroidota bacterium]MBS1628881.1 hypothetical protein [Bacteroidota bacterium]